MATQTKLNFFKILISSRLFLASLLGLLLTLASLFSIYLPWATEEQEMVPRSTEFKKGLNEKTALGHGADNNTLARDFLIIDVSNDMQLYCDSGQAKELGLVGDQNSGTSPPCGAGPDLKKLTALFKWLSGHPESYNVIVCDLLFGELPRSRETDSLLSYTIKMIQQTPDSKILFSGIYDKNRRQFLKSDFAKNIPDYCLGAVNEEEGQERFLRYQLCYNHTKVKTLPLLMYERINHCRIKAGLPGFSWYSRENGHSGLASNLFIPEMLFSAKDIDELPGPGNFNDARVDSSVGKMELWQCCIRFANTDNYYLREVLTTRSPHKRNIFIGSFNHQNSDVHNTVYGNLDGGIVMLNVYYNLIHGANGVSIWYNLFLFICFTGVFWQMFFRRPYHYTGKKVWLGTTVELFMEELHYFLLLLISLLSSFIFNRAPNFITLLVGVFLVSKFYKIYHRIKKAKDMPKASLR